MQTLVLGTEATRFPLEDFLQNLEDEAEVVDADGRVRFHVVPTSAAAYDHDYQARIAELFADKIHANMDELTRRSLCREGGTSTPELLQSLNSLPCAGE